MVTQASAGGGTRLTVARALSLFFIKVIGLYLTGVAAWHVGGVDRVYLHAFREAHTEVFRWLHRAGGRWVVVLAEPEKRMGEFDTDLHVLNTVNKSIGTQPIKAQYRGYAPMWLLTSLILATPVSWCRRAVALLAGGVMLWLWITLGIFLLVLKAYVTPGELALYEWSEAPRSVLNFVTEVISTSTATQFAVPVLVWVLVTFRAGDVALLLGFASSAREQVPVSTAVKPSQRNRRH